MGISVDPNAQPTISSLNPDGTVGGGDYQTAGEILADFFGSLAAQLGVTGLGAAVGFAFGGFPGAILGAYFGPVALGGMLGGGGSSDAMDDHLNDRSMRQMGEVLRGSTGFNVLGGPTPYTGPDANLMVPNYNGNRLSFHTKIKPIIPKLVKSLSMTTRDRNTLGLFMLTIKTNRVDETIKGLARARLVYRSFYGMSEFQSQSIYNTEITNLNRLLGTERDRVRQLCNIQKLHADAGRKPIKYSGTTIKHSVSGTQRTERWIAAKAVTQLVGKVALSTTEKKVIGKWARAKLTTASITDAYCRDLAKRNSTYQTHIKTQIVAAKAQF